MTARRVSASGLQVPCPAGQRWLCVTGPIVLQCSLIPAEPWRSVIEANNEADCVRYVLIRKLAAGLRHRLMGDLQAIAFTAELCSRMLDSNRGSDQIRGQLEQISAHTGVAADSCRALVEWLRPDDSARSSFGEVVDLCLRVAGDDWSLRGIAASVRLSDECRDATVARHVACELVVASVLTLVDLRRGGVRLELRAERVDGNVMLDVRSEAGEDNGMPPLPPTYRQLDWNDVMVLASAHGVQCTCRREQYSISLRFPALVGD
jgi:hypothetical protein